MTRAFAKSDRIKQVERLLLNSRVPLSQAEIARRCDVHRATIGRLVQGMIDAGVPVRFTNEGLLSIERTAYISTIHLKLHEALATFLACRLLARYSDKPNRHTVTTLEKLGTALQTVMPALGYHIGDTSQALTARLPKELSDYQRWLEQLTEAWAEGRKVRLWYRPLKAHKAFQHTFSPYFLEPAAIGYSTYVIGLAEPPGALRTRKLERIERVELTDEPFTVPAGFNANTLLAGAWGIWFDQGDEPTRVMLRFSGAQAIRRIGETIWHPSQQTESDPAGRLLWTAQIDEPQEMLPWIRGWGADCEVLEPADLRAQVVGELRRQAALYTTASDTSAQAPSEAPDILVAHTPAPGSDTWHPLVDHLVAVAELARGFAAPFGAGQLAHQLGLWHDVGKANPDFQAYLKRCHTDPRQKGTGPDHKAAGALLALRHCEPLALLVQGHHGGLPDQTDLMPWLHEKQQLLVSGTQTLAVNASIERLRALLPAIEPAAPLTIPTYVRDELSAEFFLRMLFSALVDADFLDTEAARNPRAATLRGSTTTIEELLRRFDADQQQKLGGAGPVNAARDVMYSHCREAAIQPPGLFRLAMPTGGGKTRAGMGFALDHAVRHGKRRVVVAVPFISITEQTAATYREIFEDSDDTRPIVLEHHSGAEVHRSEADEYTPEVVWSRLAAENWDAPVIVTTTVQLFESMFGNRTRPCRKLHHLADSVIILDEAQVLPPNLLSPILDGLRELCQNYGATVVLSTATQPSFEQLPPFRDLPAYDIVPQPQRYFHSLSRVRYEWRIAQPMPWAEVAELVRAEQQALVVLNTKGDALTLLDALGDDPSVLHLSTLLCGAHRRAVIAEVRRRLAAGEPCRLVSTQVIEAGVDLDFPLVLRALGPLDRVIQAAGRCNREGLLPDKGHVIVFRSEGERMPPGGYKLGTQQTATLLQHGQLDMNAPETVTTYFRAFYSALADDRQHLDTKAVQKLRRLWRFAEVANAMRLIDEATEDVVVSYGTEEEQERVDAALTAITRGSATRQDYRTLQPFIVAIRAESATRYRAHGWIATVAGATSNGPRRWVGCYDPLRGLVADDDRSLLVV